LTSAREVIEPHDRCHGSVEEVSASRTDDARRRVGQYVRVNEKPERRFPLLASAVFVGVLVLVAYLWTWIGAWGVEPDRYDGAADWWLHFALPRAGWSLVVGIPVAVASAVVVHRNVRAGD
jgi:uncharacterized membrane protein YoaT (DUF817 family)